VQAQAAGRPVIAFGQGGALDTVIPGKTGELFYQQTVDSLAQAMLDFDASRYAVEDLRANAERFDQSVFEREISHYIEQALHAHRTQQPFVWKKMKGQTRHDRECSARVDLGVGNHSATLVVDDVAVGGLAGGDGGAGGVRSCCATTKRKRLYDRGALQRGTSS
jgi:hypothetical protein